jgi:hypothetical protein
VALALCGVLQAVDGVALTQAVVFRSDRPALLTLKRRPGDAPEDEVLAAPSLVRQRHSTMWQLGALTGINPTGLRRALDRTADRPTVKLALVPAVVGARLQAAELPGLLVTQAPRRGYPYSPALAPLLGFVGLASPADLRARPDPARRRQARSGEPEAAVRRAPSRRRRLAVLQA